MTGQSVAMEKKNAAHQSYEEVRWKAVIIFRI